MKFKLQGSHDLWNGLYNLQIYISIYKSDETNRTIPPGIFKSIWRVFRKEMFPLMMKKEVLVCIYDILASSVVVSNSE